MKDPSESARDAFGSSIRRLELISKIAGGAVVVGVVAEIFPDVVWCFHGTCGFTQLAAIIGSVTVALGVAVEVLMASRIARKSELIQELANHEIAELHARAAEAEKSTAELRAQVADRHLSALQMKILERDLVSLKGLTLLVYALKEREPMQYAGELCFALTSAGILAQLKPFTPPIGFSRGITLAYGDEAEQTAVAIENAFVAAALVEWPMDRAIKTMLDKAAVFLQIM